MRIARPALAALGLLALPLAACGGDNSAKVTGTTTASSSASSASSAPPTTAAPSATTASGSSTSAGSSSASTSATSSGTGATTTTDPVAAVKELATKALLTPAEVGTGFTQGNYTPNDPNTPTACGSKSADAVVRPGVQVGTVIQNGTTNQAMLEEIAVYNDANQAGQAYTAGTNGLACTTGTVPGSGDKVTISAPQDLTSQFEESTKATGWQISGADIQAIVVAVQLQAAIVTFQFQAPAGVDATQPDPIAVAKTGYTKVHNS